MPQRKAVRRLEFIPPPSKLLSLSTSPLPPMTSHTNRKDSPKKGKANAQHPLSSGEARQSLRGWRQTHACPARLAVTNDEMVGQLSIPETKSDSGGKERNRKCTYAIANFIRIALSI